MGFRTEDPLADYDRYCRHQENELEKLPRCSACGEPIEEEYCFCINDELICEECMDYYKIETPVE